MRASDYEAGSRPRCAAREHHGLVRSASGAEPAPAPAGADAVTERVRQIILEDGGGPEWGADPPAGETAERGEPVAATVLSGAGHALVALEALARRTQRDTRCTETRRLDDAAAAAAWLRGPIKTP